MKHLGLGFGLVAALSATPALAEDCGPLNIVSSVTLQPSESHLQELVPVKINGADKLLLLDTGGYTTQLTPQAVEDMKLPVGGSVFQLTDIRGNVRSATATVSSFEMGTMRAKDISMMIMGDDAIGESAKFDGLLASDLFLAYDLDMDFGHDKLNFISTDHCPGKVVYWQAQALAEVPMHIVNGHYLIDITLDGRRLVALLDTGATRSTLGAGEAQQYFGLTPNSPDLPLGGKANGSITTYLHKFGVLSFEGVEIHDPSIAILQSGLLQRRQAPIGSHIATSLVEPWDMILGMDMLRHLHLYIATKERKLYITPA